MALNVLARAAAHGAIPHAGPELGAKERWLSGLAGGALLGAALARHDPSSLLFAAAGGYGIYRGTTGRCPITRSLGIARGLATRDRPAESRASITISATPEELFDRWREVERWPEWMRFVTDAQREDGRARFTIRTPEDLGDRPIALEGVFIEHPTEHMIQFGTDDDAPVYYAVTTRFVPAPDGRSTEVHVQTEHAVPAGKPAAAMSALFGGAPEQQLRADLRRFRQWVETESVTTTLGQPSGLRKGPRTRLASVRERLAQGAPRALSDPRDQAIPSDDRDRITEIEIIEILEMPATGR